MKIKGVSYGDVRAAAEEVGLGVTYKPASGYGLDVRLHPIAGGIYQATDPRDRRMPSRGGVGIVCIHGYEAFIEALLERRPRAIIHTLQASYYGLDDFDNRQDEIIVRLAAAYSHQTCDCE